jgi:hypothetical protein
MKQGVCPRCQGSGVIEEDGTLVGLSPFQDRPSGVNDDEWTDPGDVGEPTAVIRVPTFKMPKEIPLRIPSPKPPPDLTRIASDSERPTKVIHGRKALLEEAAGINRKRSWGSPVLVLVLMGIGIAMGFAAGLHKDRWVHLIEYMTVEQAPP